METLIGLMELFFINSRLRIARCLEYRFDFIVGSLVSLGISCFGPLVQYLIFTATNGYPGWNLQQIMLFQGFILLWFGIKDTLFGDLKQYALDLIRRGELDRLLLKPYPSIGFLLVNGFNLKNCGSLIAGIIICAYSIQSLGLKIGWLQITLVFVSWFFGLLLNMAIDITYCGIVVLAVQINRIGEIIDGVLNYSRYPAELFSKTTRTILLIIVPFAIWIYFPTQIFLKRIDWMLGAACLVCALLFWLSLKFWNWCLKKYTSAGG